MGKIKSLADLKALRDRVKADVKLREDGTKLSELVQVKVAMATCGIAAGSRDIMNFMIDDLISKGIGAVVTHTGCMGYCYAEPTIEVTLPGESPIIFGNVDKKRASEIIDRYIKKGEIVDGLIPVNFKTIDSHS